MTKTKNTSDYSTDDNVYDIAAVCRLTGLNAPSLRMWEKRHQVVNPRRTETGRRQYTRRDIQRLTLLKALSDHGHSIRTLVELPIVELERRLEECSKRATTQESASERDQVRLCRIAVVGSHLATLLEVEKSFLEDEASFQTYENFDEAESVDSGEEADLLVIEIPALFSEDTNRVRRLVTRFQALRAVIIYVYAQDRTLENLSQDQGVITAIRAPFTLGDLREICKTDIALASRSASATIENAPLPERNFGQFRERKYSQSQLAKLGNISSAVECECPNHLASLLEALNGFEEYSAQCENRNAADAKVHAYLHQMTAHARATIEDALDVLVEFEGIDVGE